MAAGWREHPPRGKVADAREESDPQDSHHRVARKECTRHQEEAGGRTKEGPQPDRKSTSQGAKKVEVHPPFFLKEPPGELSYCAVAGHTTVR